jgi:hypothetical protein
MEICGECGERYDTDYEGVTCLTCGSPACLKCQSNEDCYECGNLRTKEKENEAM